MNRIVRIAILLIGGLLLTISGIYAQKERIIIRGKVIDADDNLPLIGVYICETNKDNRIVSSAISDINGSFALTVNDVTNRLVFSLLGYEKLEVNIGSEREIKVTMKNASTGLSAVVVTASKVQQVGNMPIKERDISMAIGKLDAAEIADLNVASVDEAIQGRLAGVDVTANAGDPGSGMSIKIRGTTSISGNSQPLIVVDGIPLETEIGAGFDFSTASEEEFSQLLNIAPSDIKEIVVLKDAAANAIWGAKAANGVLQITTQRGSISAPQFTFRITGTYKPLAEMLPTLSGDEYTTMILEAQQNAGNTLDPLYYPQFAYDKNNPEYFYNYSQNTNWIDAVTQDAFSQEYSMSLRGGTAKTKYSFSAGYLDDEGNTINTGFQRLNTRLNLDYSVSDKLRFTADIAYTHSDITRNYVPNDDKESANVRGEAYTKMPNQSIYYYNVYGQETPVYFTPLDNPQGTYPNVFNPVAMALDGKYNVTSESIIPKMSLIFRPNNTWRYTFDVGFQATTNKEKKFLPQSATGLVWSDTRKNTASDVDGESFTIQTFNKLYFTPPSKDENVHRFIGLLGLNTYDRSSYSYSATTSNLASSQLQDPSIPSRIYSSGSISSSTSQQRTLSSYINLNYTFLDRYTIYGNANIEGNSRFGENYRFGFFPAISGRYRLSGEPIFSKMNWLNDFSLRASYGMSGQAPDRDYLYYNNYQAYSYEYMGYNATYPSNLELANLRWEQSYTQNYGFNFTAFSSKLNIEGEYYIRTIKDQYMKSISIPTSSGFSSMAANYGTVENSGWELNVNFNPIRSKNLNFSVAFNIARSQNKVKEISAFTSLFSGDWNKNGSYLKRTMINQPTGSVYGYLYDGVYLNQNQLAAKDAQGNTIYTQDTNGNQVPVNMTFGYNTSAEYEFKPGDTRYKDLNHDGTINYQDVAWLGDINPLFFGGITPSIKWKQFSVNTVFFFRYGNSVINMSRMNLENMYTYDNQSTAVLKRWRQPYEDASQAPKDLISRALYGTGYNWLASDRFVEDGSFIRWKSLTLRYNLSKRLSDKMGMSDFYIYTTINNLKVWTNYTGQDPEVSLSKGEDYSQSPVPKTITLGINVTL